MEKIILETVAQRIKKRRNELKLSLEELGKRANMSSSTLQRYETGGIKNIPLNRLHSVAKALEYTPSELLGIANKGFTMIELSDYLKEKGFKFEIFENKVKVKKGSKSTSLELEVLNDYFKDGFKNIENLLNSLLDR